MPVLKPAIARRKPDAKTSPADEFVERLAVSMEAEGLPRIAGRIFGLLLLSEEPLSLDAIAERLGASKASASVNTRLLEHRGLIEQIGLPGDRRDYYQSVSNLFVRTMEQRLAKWERFHSIMNDGIAQLEVSPVIRSRMKNFENEFASVHEVLKAALLKCQARRHR
ncbi:MAG TPA: MarR family transcriptional regulator [Gemmatimonadaceae bacterium]|nr:MarR family transcriptional regulator [Gemmatimonadaceae bacterium]